MPTAILISLALLGAALYMSPLAELVRFSFSHNHYSHMVLIPFVSAYFFYLSKDQILARTRISWLSGILLAAAGILYIAASALKSGLVQNDYLSFIAASFCCYLWGVFLLCFGTNSFRLAAFPLLFLVFIIPIPTAVLAALVYFLQAGSAEMTHWLFMLTGVPVLRDGFTFALPGVTIEVAEQCSGIRSSLALLITGVMASHVLLSTTWKRLVAVVVLVPLAIIKNGIRIVSLTLLSIYVDPGFLHSDLHHRGGIVFFLIALCLYAPLLLILHRTETSAGQQSSFFSLLDRLGLRRLFGRLSNSKSPAI